MVLHVLSVLVILVKLWEHFSHIVHYQLRQLLVVVFNNEAEELPEIVINDVAYFLFEREWRQRFELELGVVLRHVHHPHLRVDFERLGVCLGLVEVRVRLAGCVRLLADAAHHQQEVRVEAERERVRQLHRQLHVQRSPDVQLVVVPLDRVRELVLLHVQPSEQVDVLRATLAGRRVESRRVAWLYRFPGPSVDAVSLALCQILVVVVES